MPITPTTPTTPNVVKKEGMADRTGGTALAHAPVTTEGTGTTTTRTTITAGGGAAETETESEKETTPIAQTLDTPPTAPPTASLLPLPPPHMEGTLSLKNCLLMTHLLHPDWTPHHPSVRRAQGKEALWTMIIELILTIHLYPHHLLLHPLPSLRPL